MTWWQIIIVTRKISTLSIRDSVQQNFTHYLLTHTTHHPIKHSLVMTRLEHWVRRHHSYPTSNLHSSDHRARAGWPSWHELWLANSWGLRISCSWCVPRVQRNWWYTMRSTPLPCYSCSSRSWHPSQTSGHLDSGPWSPLSWHPPICVSVKMKIKFLSLINRTKIPSRPNFKFNSRGVVPKRGMAGSWPWQSYLE